MSLPPHLENRLRLEICTPERTPVNLDAAEIVAPGLEGVFTVLPGHTPLLAMLGIGVLVARGLDGLDRFYAINGGFAEVANNRVAILTETAESEQEIDSERARRALERAEQRLRQREEGLDVVRAEIAMAKALARLDAHDRVEI